MTSAAILIADDDPALREVVRYALTKAGHRVVEAKDGAEALARFALEPFDLVVLDVLMPEQDGIAVCRALRKHSTVPVLFLSSRAEEVDRLLALELGGDDYVVKPFSPRELVVRVAALLRRTRAYAAAPADPDLLQAGPVSLHRSQVRCWVGPTEVTLTVTELRLLQALIERKGHVLERDALVERAYGGPHHVSDRTLDSHVRHIRAKLREAGADDVIETVHGLGFRVRP